MASRTASCNCGELRVMVEGEPVRISICHCLACQKRTGSVFGMQARYPEAQVMVDGSGTDYRRIAESGNAVTSTFCPVCGSTVYWRLDSAPGLVAVAVGGFADPAFPPPRHSVYERSAHGWVALPDRPGVEHLD